MMRGHQDVRRTTDGEPVAYLVPLHDDGLPTRSYLLAFGRIRRSLDAMVEVRAHVEGFGAPWRDGKEVQVLHLDTQGLRSLPRDVPFRDLLTSVDWSANEPVVEIPPDFMLPPCSSSHAILRQDVPELRSHAEARRRAGEMVLTWLPDGAGASWRTGAALVLVDLDEIERRIVEAAVQLSIGDFARAGVWERDRMTLEGRAHEWNSQAGAFRSAEETRRRFEAERKEAIERLQARYYPFPVHRARLTYVRPEVQQRAEERGTSVPQEWRQAGFRGLLLVLPQVVAEWFTGVQEWIRASRDPARLAKRRWQQWYDALVKRVRQPLNNEVTDDFCPGPRQQYERPRDLQRSDEFWAGQAGDDLGEDDLLEKIAWEDRRKVLDAVAPDLGERERELVAAILGDVDPLEWGRAHGLADGTVYAMLAHIRAKARNVLRRMRLDSA